MVTDDKRKVTFYFDPACPFAYKTSLWIREARKVRPLEIDWRFLSLRAINEGSEIIKEAHSMSIPAFRVMAEARIEYGPETADALYLSIGRLRHEEKKDIGHAQVLEAAVQAANMNPGLVAHALTNEETFAIIEEDHNSGVVNGAFGVPSIELDSDNRPFFGPVIDEPLTGGRAGELWDHFVWLIGQPEFYEIKRNRS